MLTSATRLPRTNADKRSQVEMLLKNEQWQQMSDRFLAEHCGVSAPFVAKIRVELAASGTINISSARVDRKGRRIETANIGTQTKSRQDKSAPTITSKSYQELRTLTVELVRTQESSRQLEAENQQLKEEIAHLKTELALLRVPLSESQPVEDWQIELADEKIHIISPKNKRVRLTVRSFPG